MAEKLAVIKRDPRGRQTWRYEGHLLERSGPRLVLEAYFDRDDFPYMGTTLKRGDRFVETYFSDRGYNIFEIYDREDRKLKGIYCNITTPARFSEGRVEYEDLFLDVWVDPEGRQTVLDRDEFEAADLDEATRQGALRALEELQEYLKGYQRVG